MLIEGDIRGPYTDAAIESVLDGWPQLVEAVPGVSGVACQGSRFSGSLMVTMPFGQMRCRLAGEVLAHGDGALAIMAKGKPLALAGMFEARVEVRKLATGGGLHYALSVTTFGRLASLGESMLSNVSSHHAPEFERSVRLLLEQA